MGENVDEIPEPGIRKNLRTEYFEFLSDFKDFMSEFYRDSVFELSIAEIQVKEKVQLFDGTVPGKVTVKNQGQIECYLGTSPMGGYRLDAGETMDFYVNRPVYCTTLSGTTTLGFIRS